MSMDNLADDISPEERLYFGEETLAKHAEELKSYSEAQEPAETVESQPETPAEKPAEPVAVEQKDTVPLATHLEERKKLQQQSRELEERYATLEGRFNEVLQRIPKPQEQQTPQPKAIEDDPIGAIKQHEAEFQAWRQQQIQQQQFTQLQNVVSTHEAQFRAEQPHYDAALQHVTAARSAEYRALGLSEPQIAQALQSDAANMAVHALRMGRNPAEMVYNLAVARGFAPPAAEKPAEAPKPEEAPAVPADKQMQMLEAGVAASKTLQGGTGGTGDLDLRALSSMSSKEIGNLSDEQWRKLAMKMN
jgi:hypothetical protein